MGKVIMIERIKATMEIREKYIKLCERERTVEAQISEKCREELDELNAIDAEKKWLEKRLGYQKPQKIHL